MEKEKVMKLPIEMVEEILLNLPVKSMLRFSSVSKEWKSIIWESLFVKRYRRRAALPGRERIVLKYSNFRRFLALSTTVPTDNYVSSSSCSGSFVCEFADSPNILALCDELWLVGDSNDSLYLWNPSMRTHKKLPNPSVVPFPHNASCYVSKFVYGLGYESVGNDYKILKIPRCNSHIRHHCGAELYSLRSDSWIEIPNFSGDIDPIHGGVFVSGNLHWLPYLHTSDRCVIISFNLSTEKFGEVDYPPTMDRAPIHVLRGMLCVPINEDQKCDIWVMKEYGVKRSWKIMFTIKYSNVPAISFIRPLYYYENGAILVRGRRGRSKKSDTVFIHQDEKTGLQELSYGCNTSEVDYMTHGISYIDSLVAPTTWSALV